MNHTSRNAPRFPTKPPASSRSQSQQHKSLQTPRRCGHKPIVGAFFCALLITLITTTTPHANAASNNTTPVLQPPSNAIAWWTYQPTQLNADATRTTGITTALAMTGRAAIASGLLADQPDAASILEALVATLAVTDRPHTLALLNITADPVTTELQDIHAILVIAGSEGHPALLRTLRTVLIDAPRAKTNNTTSSNTNNNNQQTGFGEQRRFTIPPGLRSRIELEAVAYTEPTWPAWRQISWCSTPNAFIIALGQNALETWFTAPHDPSPPWQHHIQTAAHATTNHNNQAAPIQPTDSATLRAWFNVDQLRRSTPDWFTNDARPARFIAALNLANARSFMLHAAHITPTDEQQPITAATSLIALTATWSARSEPHSVIRSAVVAPTSFPPSALELIPPNTRVAMAVRTDAAQWLTQSLDAYAATMRTERAARYAASRNAWITRNRQPLARVLAGVGDWLIVTDGGSTAGPANNAIPFPTVILSELKPGTSTRTFINDMRQLMSAFQDHVSTHVPTTPQQPAPNTQQPTSTAPLAQWTVHADTDRRFAVASWGIATRRASASTTRAVLVGGLDITIALNPNTNNTNTSNNQSNPTGIVARIADWLATPPPR